MTDDDAQHENGEAPELDLIVAAVPVLGVEPGHVAEARRALLAQGRAVDDDGLIRLLWGARALPAALDALAASQIHDAVLGASTIEIGDERSPDQAPRAPLVAVARVEGAFVIVEIIDKRALFDADGDDAVPCCIVTIPLAKAELDDPSGSVSVRRFTVGPP